MLGRACKKSAADWYCIFLAMIRCRRVGTENHTAGNRSNRWLFLGLRSRCNTNRKAADLVGSLTPKSRTRPCVLILRSCLGQIWCVAVWRRVSPPLTGNCSRRYRFISQAGHCCVWRACAKARYWRPYIQLQCCFCNSRSPLCAQWGWGQGSMCLFHLGLRRLGCWLFPLFCSCFASLNGLFLRIT